LGKGLKEQIDIYLQNVLTAQYEVSNDINHELTKGELREEFVKWIVSGEYPNLILKSGIVVCDEWQSSQNDFLWLKNNARVGHLNVYDVNDISLVMEIKSNVQASEIAALNMNASLLKERCEDKEHLRIGMFCYGSHAKKQTVINKFGFQYEKDIDAYKQYKYECDLYHNIDFFFSLDIDGENSPYFVFRGNERKDEGDKYSTKKNLLYLHNPVIDSFLMLFK
jgi:hypothetical protein